MKTPPLPRMENIVNSLWLALFLILTSSVVPAHADPICEPLLTLADAKPDFQQLRLVNINLNPKLSPSKLADTRSQLEAAGFKPFGEGELGRAWVGEIDPQNTARLSRVDGVTSVTRESSVGVDIWRDGKKSQLVIPSEFEPEDDAALWSGLRRPVRGNPPRDLKSIRRVAREKGVTIVLSDRRPATAKEIRDLEELWGARIFFAGDLRADTSLVQLPGVVLHIEPSPKSLEVQGDLNILLGRGRLLGKLNKVTESYWVRGIDPNAMAPGLRASELLARQGAPEFTKLKRALTAKVQAYLKKHNPTLLAVIRVQTREFLDAVIACSTAEYEPGAFFKGKNDYATRESDGIFMTSSMNPEQMANDYADLLEKVPLKADLDPWLRDEGTAAAAMTHGLLMHPEDVLVQQKLDLAKTEADNLMEFRVDVFEGHVVNSSFRYGLEYFPNESQGAAKMVQRFFDHAPDGDRYFTGGLDVAMLKNGSFKIIETNPGAQSSFINSSSYPVSANEALGRLLGQPTPFTRKLNSVYEQGATGQVAFLRTLHTREADGITAVNQITKFDFLCWLRDRYLVEWARQPTAKNRGRVLRRIRKVARLGGMPDGADDFEEYIIQRMKEFMSRRVR